MIANKKQNERKAIGTEVRKKISQIRTSKKVMITLRTKTIKMFMMQEINTFKNSGYHNIIGRTAIQQQLRAQEK